MDSAALLTEVLLRFFFLLTPFFVLSVFLTYTQTLDAAQRRHLALKVTGAVLVACFVILLFGNRIFALLGITVDSFRVGAGGLLFLSAVSLVHGTGGELRQREGEDHAVVPLAIPITVGPATTGALLVMSAENQDRVRLAISALGLTLAVAAVGVILLLGSHIKTWVGERGIQIISKLTGVILAAMAAQMIFTGARHLLTAP